MPDRVALVIGHRHAPGRAGAAGRGRGQVAGQVRVHRANAVHFANARDVRIYLKCGHYVLVYSCTGLNIASQYGED